MQTVTVAGGDLFRIAADQLGDATQWVRIAQLNALVDTSVQGVVTLLLPPIDASATGGVAAQ